MFGTHALAVAPLLVANLQIPSEGGLKERFVLSIVEINLLIAVRLPVRSDVNNGFVILPAKDKYSADDRVVVGAQNTNGAKEVFARCLKAVEEASDQVRRHECQCQLLRILEVRPPDRETLLVKSVDKLEQRIQKVKIYSLVVEPFNSTACPTGIHVRVSALPVLKVERGFRKRVEGVLRLRLFNRLVVVVIIISLHFLRLLLYLLLLRLGLLLLFGRRGVLKRLLDVFCSLKEALDFRLIGYSLHEADNVRQLRTLSSTNVDTERPLRMGSDDKVSKSEALSNKESSRCKL